MVDLQQQLLTINTRIHLLNRRKQITKEPLFDQQQHEYPNPPPPLHTHTQGCMKRMAECIPLKELQQVC